ncbi:Copper transport protein 86 [Candida viswanathii]|uniref:Ataxin-10 homolog n=1 Tax=Candida viswanathii TaxID=5486 RepID=A0A367YH30_9ASCO|nr:Copper transport protein 86 [Candida viswanathii]
MISLIDTTIDNTLKSLKTSDYSQFDILLADVSRAISDTLTHDNSDTVSSDRITQIVEYKPDATNESNMRLYRGLLMVVRNLAPELDTSFFPTVITSFHHFVDLGDASWVARTIETYWQILANFKRCDYVAEINDMFEWAGKVVVDVPVIHFLFRQFNTLDPEITNENLLTLLKLQDSYTMDTIFDLFNEIEFDKDISHDNKLFIHLLYDIITHESFGNWIAAQLHPQKWIELACVVVQTKDDWNNYQLAALLSWNYSLFMDHSALEIDLEDEKTEEILLGTLHILAELSKFNATKQFIEHYEDFLPRLIKFFKFIHDNVKQITIKTAKIEEISKYPSVKSYIIVILSYLAFESFDNQEKIRELGGLSLVLSNCVIDNNNPFIKEQAIVCLKYLLAKNPQNQQFVADLEAKKSVDDDVLQEVGYQVEVVDGKVTVKKKD